MITRDFRSIRKEFGALKRSQPFRNLTAEDRLTDLRNGFAEPLPSDASLVPGAWGLLPFLRRRRIAGFDLRQDAGDVGHGDNCGRS